MRVNCNGRRATSTAGIETEPDAGGQPGRGVGSAEQGDKVAVDGVADVAANRHGDDARAGGKLEGAGDDEMIDDGMRPMDARLIVVRGHDALDDEMAIVGMLPPETGNPINGVVGTPGDEMGSRQRRPTTPSLPLTITTLASTSYDSHPAAGINGLLQA